MKEQIKILERTPHQKHCFDTLGALADIYVEIGQPDNSLTENEKCLTFAKNHLGEEMVLLCMTKIAHAEITVY
jgi:hypothetical protein